MTRSGMEGTVWLEEVVDLIPANESGRSGALASFASFGDDGEAAWKDGGGREMAGEGGRRALWPR